MPLTTIVLPDKPAPGTLAARVERVLELASEVTRAEADIVLRQNFDALEHRIKQINELLRVLSNYEHSLRGLSLLEERRLYGIGTGQEEKLILLEKIGNVFLCLRRYGVRARTIGEAYEVGSRVLVEITPRPVPQPDGTVKLEAPPPAPTPPTTESDAVPVDGRVAEFRGIKDEEEAILAEAALDGDADLILKAKEYYRRKRMSFFEPEEYDYGA